MVKSRWDSDGARLCLQDQSQRVNGRSGFENFRRLVNADVLRESAVRRGIVVERHPTNEKSPVRGGMVAVGKDRKMSLLTELENLGAGDGAENIPKGLRHSARRCPDNGGATLGGDCKMTQP